MKKKGKTIRKKEFHQEQLESLSGRFSYILENISDSVVISDMQGIIRYWNRGAEVIFGYTASESVGKSINILYPEEELNKIAAIRGSLSAGQPVTNLEIMERKKDNTLVNILLSIIPLKDSDGSVEMFAGIGTDITLMKELEAKMVEAEKLRTVHNTIVALNHHLNQRLTSLYLSLSLVEKKVSQEKIPPRSILKDMGKNVDGIREIIEKISSIQEVQEEVYLGDKTLLKLKTD